jgi:hypothetical protein
VAPRELIHVHVDGPGHLAELVRGWTTAGLLEPRVLVFREEHKPSGALSDDLGQGDLRFRPKQTNLFHLHRVAGMVSSPAERSQRPTWQRSLSCPSAPFKSGPDLDLYL